MMSEVTLSDEIQLPQLDRLADIPYAQETPVSWDPDYRKIWQELQVASRNKAQLGGHIREIRSKLSQVIAQRDEGLAREAELQLDVDTWKETAKSFEDFYRKIEVERDAFEQRLAEAQRLLLDVRGQLCGPDQRAIDAFIAKPA